MRFRLVNLDRAADRLAAVQENFGRWAPPGAVLERVRAVEAVEAAEAEGSIRPAEKACFLSHLRALESSEDEDLFVAEDDVLFGPHSVRRIQAVSTLPRDRWDLVYTDVAITDLPPMVELFRLRRALEGAAHPQLLSLAATSYAGSTAYVVNARARRRLVEMLRAAPMNQPYDLTLRQAVYRGAIKGFVLFPFATTLSPFAEASQVQDGAARIERLWNAFRRLVWESRDLDALAADLSTLDRDQVEEPDADLFARLLRALLSSDLPEK